MKKRVDWTNKPIYAAVVIILVFAFAITLQDPTVVSEEQPLPAPSRGEITPGTEKVNLFFNLNLKKSYYSIADPKFNKDSTQGYAFECEIGKACNPVFKDVNLGTDTCPYLASLKINIPDPQTLQTAHIDSCTASPSPCKQFALLDCSDIKFGGIQ